MMGLEPANYMESRLFLLNTSLTTATRYYDIKNKVA